jgi:hypothetical protein
MSPIDTSVDHGDDHARPLTQRLGLADMQKSQMPLLGIRCRNARPSEGQHQRKKRRDGQPSKIASNFHGDSSVDARPPPGTSPTVACGRCHSRPDDRRRRTFAARTASGTSTKSPRPTINTGSALRWGVVSAICVGETTAPAVPMEPAAQRSRPAPSPGPRSRTHTADPVPAEPCHRRSPPTDAQPPPPTSTDQLAVGKLRNDAGSSMSTWISTKGRLAVVDQPVVGPDHPRASSEP